MHDSWINKLVPFRQIALDVMEKVGKLKEKTYPLGKDVFNAFNMPFDDVKVIIIGQDPYHGEGQANGLAFSVNKDIKIPKSLENIYIELQDDLNIKLASHGDLTDWVKQGVLLLNSSLSVSEGRAGSHKDFGWQEFTTKVIELISQEKEGLVFILWGMDAVKKVQGIDLEKHYIIKSTHPSFFSAHKSTRTLKAFFGSKPFSECNEYLKYRKKDPINWEIEC